MKNIIQRASLIMLGLIPAVSQAHPGHDHQSGFSAGFLHSFTGMDHMIMALALGVLLWSAARQWKILGMASMATVIFEQSCRVWHYCLTVDGYSCTMVKIQNNSTCGYSITGNFSWYCSW